MLETQNDIKLDPLSERIYDFLGEFGFTGARAWEVHEKLNVAHFKVRYHLLKLQASGLVGSRQPGTEDRRYFVKPQVEL
jgi:hypothetical protein